MSTILKQKSEIIPWLKKYKIENYTLVEDVQYGYVVDVIGDVYLSNKKLINIPIKFGKVSEDFHCDNNQLTSLLGSPITVGGIFVCSYNELTSLEHCPTSVDGNFHCHSNLLANLESIPVSVGGNFYCYDNPLLGAYQSITDLAKLKEKILSDIEKELLSTSLERPGKSTIYKL